MACQFARHNHASGKHDHSKLTSLPDDEVISAITVKVSCALGRRRRFDSVDDLDSLAVSQHVCNGESSLFFEVIATLDQISPVRMGDD